MNIAVLPYGGAPLAAATGLAAMASASSPLRIRLEATEARLTRRDEAGVASGFDEDRISCHGSMRDANLAVL